MHSNTPTSHLSRPKQNKNTRKTTKKTPKKQQQQQHNKHNENKTKILQEIREYKFLSDQQKKILIDFKIILDYSLGQVGTPLDTFNLHCFDNYKADKSKSSKDTLRKRLTLKIAWFTSLDHHQSMS